MMMTRIASWLNRTAQHGAMDVAQQDTELNTYAYNGQGGHLDFLRDVICARSAVVIAHGLVPAYAQADLDLALRSIDAAAISGEVDDGLYAMSDAAESVRRAHRALLARCSEYRALELVTC